MSIKKVLIMAGGTGGHIFPGIALANGFKEKNIEVVWLGNQNSMEAKLVPSHNITFYSIAIQPLRGKGLIQKLKFPVNLLHAVLEARKIIQEIKPDIIISMGGYVAGPGGIAAKLCGIPLMIHESNSIAGMTNKYLAKIATKIFTGFPNVLPKGIFTGNPVRAEIENIIKTSDDSQHKLNVLIIGGSRGAKALNDIVPEAIKLLPENIKPNIFHQTGEGGMADYGNIPATVVPFIHNIAEQYSWADIIICRAGALTLAEITSVGIPAILIPYPHAVDDHQTKNADYLVKNHAADLLPQSELTPRRLADTLKDIMLVPGKRVAMAKNSRELRKERVVEKIVSLLL
ncbi:MAG TPA: undecaprenyldiphospho-muramoylpentapeptide beta-N-acetylglucosaminyltransferase [Gammaproteobacteria bacterium]|nr:undecaprenyldiphospho-muramoylpentapeptide beta-N-acetylglucosaminyltransferase [Gammaproteobacteria bacterium]